MKEHSYTKYNSRTYMVLFLGLILGMLVLFVISVCVGSAGISLKELLNFISGKSTDETIATIIVDFRMPRALAAIILGGALALSGFLLQTFFQNPIAGPFVLGISSGAKLVVALTMILFVSHTHYLSSFELICASFLGSLICMGIVLLVARKINNMSVLVLAGVMIGYICNAITDFVIAFADDSSIVNLHNWSMGSLSGISWDNMTVISIVVLISFALTLGISKPMNAYQLGEEYANSVGVNLVVFRILLVVLSSILSACVTAFAGPVSFVGIAVPQIMKKMFHTTKPIIMIPACFLGGGLFCMVCDLVARTIFAPTELSISTVTALFGAPIVIAVMLKQQKLRYQEG